MIELIYVSRANSRFNQHQLEQLLQNARLNNQHNDITGLLLYDGFGTFIQAIEGPVDKIDALFAKIKKDKRHSNINRIGYKHITTRSFEQWQMGFKLIDNNTNCTLPGYSQFMNAPHKPDFIHKHQSFTTKMLNHFRDNT